MNKKNVLILFGGESNEYDISLKSATNVLNSIDTSLYNIITVGITKDGKWYLYEGSFDKIKDNLWTGEVKYSAFISPSKEHKGIIVLKDGKYEFIDIDVCFPVLHGANGEDGTIQGLLQLSGIPYVGGNTLAMSVTMDKRISKIVFENAGIPVVPVTYIMKEYDIENLKENLSFPVFVKPANSGSSVGCHKVEQAEALKEAIDDALKTDDTVLIEKYINCREVEFAVLGNVDIFVSMPGEITSDSTFYDYDTKYVNTENVNLNAPANIPEDLAKKMQEYAVKAYKSVGLSGLSRADFFIDKDTNEIYLNEINSIPGFTSLSMYPILMSKHGLDSKTLFNKLVELALKR